jgi:hypothetical protein
MVDHILDLLADLCIPDSKRLVLVELLKSARVAGLSALRSADPADSFHLKWRLFVDTVASFLSGSAFARCPLFLREHLDSIALIHKALAARLPAYGALRDRAITTYERLKRDLAPLRRSLLDAGSPSTLAAVSVSLSPSVYSSVFEQLFPDRTERRRVFGEFDRRVSEIRRCIAGVWSLEAKTAAFLDELRVASRQLLEAGKPPREILEESVVCRRSAPIADTLEIWRTCALLSSLLPYSAQLFSG